MKPGVFAYLCLIMSIVIFASSPVAAMDKELDPPDITSGAALLMEMETGTIIFEKSSEARMYPASITKIVTGIVALEHAGLDEIVTVSEEARYEDGTRVFLAPGEQKTVEMLLYGLLLNSGNDAATAIAEHIDGNKENFAKRMNEFVRKIGAENTHFANPHGLHDEEHYTTARDMGKIAQYAMKNPVFREIVHTKILPWDGEEWDSELVNHNKLLWRYEGATGIKTGYTSKSGNTIVASAARDGVELIVVLLQGKSSEAVYQDAAQLLDYGFEFVKLHPLEAEQEEVEETAAMPQPLESEESHLSALPALDEPEPEKERRWGWIRWPITFVWFIMNAFLLLVGYLRWRKRRKRGKYQLYKY